jgi:hypothetical protein
MEVKIKPKAIKKWDLIMALWLGYTILDQSSTDRFKIGGT